MNNRICNALISLVYVLIVQYYDGYSQLSYTELMENELVLSPECNAIQ